MPNTITIENSEPRVYSICDAPLKPTEQLQDVLHPGLNVVDAAAWAKVRAVPAVAALLQSGSLRELADAPSAPAPQDAPPPPPSLADMKAADAIALVQTVTDRPTLEAWYADETRTTVLSAIEAQLAVVGG